jgi:beta-galactosidase
MGASLTHVSDRSTILSSGTLSLPTISARTKGTCKLPEQSTQHGSCETVYLTISLHLKHSTAWAESGHEVAWVQQRIPSTKSPAPEPYLGGSTASKPQVTTTIASVTIFGADFSFVFDKNRGNLTRWKAHGHDLLEADSHSGASIIPSFWRSSTDNDAPSSLPYWQRFGVDSLTSQLRTFVVDNEKKDRVIVKTQLFVTPPVLSWGWECDLEYTMDGTGSLHVIANSFTPVGSFPRHVPRVGLNLCLNKSLNQVEWLGLGPGESYPDKASSQRMGIWQVDSISDLHTPYDVPQEGGNHMGTEWVSLTGSHFHGRGVKASRLDKHVDFNFAASRFSDEIVQKAKHPSDLVEGEATLVRLDVAVAGVGTEACGPGVKDEDLVKCREYKFGFKLESL